MAKLKILKSSEVLELRWLVLRKGRELDSAHMSGDKDDSSIHLGIESNQGEILAVASFMAEDLDSKPSLEVYRLRGMAVREGYQAKGYGTIIFNFAVSMLKSKRVKTIWCNARVSASDFYLKQGFKVMGESFEIEHTGPHYKMYLDL